MKRSKEVYIFLNKKYENIPIASPTLFNSLSKKQISCDKDSYFIDYRTIKTNDYFIILNQIVKESLNYISYLVMDNEQDLNRFNHFSSLLNEEMNNCYKLFNNNKIKEAIILLESMIKGIIKYYKIEELEYKRMTRQKNKGDIYEK